LRLRLRLRETAALATHHDSVSPAGGTLVLDDDVKITVPPSNPSSGSSRRSWTRSPTARRGASSGARPASTTVLGDHSEILLVARLRTCSYFPSLPDQLTAHAPNLKDGDGEVCCGKHRRNPCEGNTISARSKQITYEQVVRRERY